RPTSLRHFQPSPGHQIHSAGFHHLRWRLGRYVGAGRGEPRDNPAGGRICRLTPTPPLAWPRKSPAPKAEPARPGLSLRIWRTLNLRTPSLPPLVTGAGGWLWVGSSHWRFSYDPQNPRRSHGSGMIVTRKTMDAAVEAERVKAASERF